VFDVFIPDSMNGMTGGAHCQREGEGREGGVGTGSGLDGNGLWAGSPSGPKGFPRPFNKFSFS
jgi:hypothetical protein